VTGNLAASMRRESAKRKESLKRISKLYEFSNQLASLARGDEIIEALSLHLERCLDRRVTVLEVNKEGRPEIAPAAKLADLPGLPTLGHALERIGESPFHADSWTFIGLVVNDRPLAMAAFEGDTDHDQIEIARSLCEQAAVALDRTQLNAELEEARLITETEQLRSALLSSVSHDLRTPLASIIGASSSLLEYGASFSNSDKEELLTSIFTEAQRLDRYIQNLLDMTRLGGGKLSLRRDWVDLSDVVASAVSRLDSECGSVAIVTQIDPAIPLLHVHGVLIEQALFNLVDNAIRFSPQHGDIDIVALLQGDSVDVCVVDQGPGIPDSEREKVFDMFYTLSRGDRSHLQGTGLGLAICRGMVGAHGGSVLAEPGPEGKGTCIRISLPLGEAQRDMSD
jgi:two-component system sensor histidine kinase KdpD